MSERSQLAVHLIALTEAEYAEFAEEQVLEYANQLVRAGEVDGEHGVATARARLADLLADRLRASAHEFLAAVAAQDGARVGWIWLSPAPEFLGPGHDGARWLSQITVGERHRGRGWGRAILLELERRLVALGVEQLWLRVFDWNVVARRLYESLGFELATQFPTDAHLRKYLVQGLPLAARHAPC